jgi:hypothetical protein
VDHIKSESAVASINPNPKFLIRKKVIFPPKTMIKAMIPGIVGEGPGLGKQG